MSKSSEAMIDQKVENLEGKIPFISTAQLVQVESEVQLLEGVESNEICGLAFRYGFLGEDRKSHDNFYRKRTQAFI